MKYHLFEIIMHENGAFTPLEQMLHFLDFFQCCLKIEMMS